MRGVMAMFAEKIIPKIILKNTLKPSELEQLWQLIARLHTDDVKEIHLDLSELSEITPKMIKFIEKICKKYEKLKVSGYSIFQDFFVTTKASFFPQQCISHIQEEEEWNAHYLAHDARRP